MTINDKFNIYQQDKYNICIQENKLIKPKDSEPYYKWVECGKFFGTFKEALSWLANELISRELNNKDYNEILIMIYQMQEALSQLEIGVKKENE